MVGLIQARGALIMLILAVLASGLIFPGLLQGANLANVVTAASFVGLVTIGQTFVIILGGFDLAVGSMVGLGSVIAAYTVPYGWPLAFLLPILTGAAVGLIDGLLIARAKMAPFIVTLAALLALEGRGGGPRRRKPGHPITRRVRARGQRHDARDRQSDLAACCSPYGAAALLLNRTAFGAAVFAIGGNEEAARMMGVRVDRIKILTYVLSDALAGLTGALLAAHLNSGLSSAGTGYELQSIAAAVIGGVLLTGGVGTMLGALSGALLLGLIDNIINHIGTLSAYYQGLASGALLLLAVVIQAGLTRRRAA